MLSSSREDGPVRDILCDLASAAVMGPMQLSGCGRGKLFHNFGTVDRGGVRRQSYTKLIWSLSFKPGVP